MILSIQDKTIDFYPILLNTEGTPARGINKEDHTMPDEKKLPDEALHAVSGGKIEFTSEEEARQAWDNFQWLLKHAEQNGSGTGGT